MKNKRLITGILLGLLIAVVIVIASRMAYESGYVKGQFDVSKQDNECLQQCSKKQADNSLCYTRSCVDTCLGINGYGGYYYPSPFMF